MVTWRPGLVAGVIALLAAVLFTLIGLGSFRGLVLGQDLAVFDQTVRAYAHFQAPDALSGPFSPILIALVPVYWIWPSAKMLTVAQALLFAGSSFFVGWYGLRRGMGVMAYVVQIAFVVSFGLLSAALFDFHETAFGLPILLYGLWAFLEKRDGHLIVAWLLMCLVNGDMTMFALGIGLALIVTGRRLFGVIMGAASVAVTLLLVFVTGSPTWGSIGAFLPNLFSLRGLLFLLLIAVTAGIGVARPVLLAVVPPVLIRLATTDPVSLGLSHHYGVLVTAVAIVALIDGWAWLGEKRGAVAKSGRAMQVAVLVLLAITELFAVGAPFDTAPQYRNVQTRIEMLWTGNQRAVDMRAVAAQIPDGANVAADVFLLSQIVDRATVQVVHPGEPVEADYVWLYTSTTAYDNQSTPWVSDLFVKLISANYTMVDYRGPFILLQRIGA
ncbi:MAG: DUF2079 domain-containing protein [Propionibacteriaceae bacterium]|nr:DUF2079 domain-containing protein [Propionibacteriaceae bacterium]